MTTWFTSDLHFGHANIIKYENRPFDSVDEMNEGIIERWNSMVQPSDHVWVLGDVCMGKLRETLPLCAQLNGSKTLIPGNHDKPWNGHKKQSTAGYEMFIIHTSGRSVWRTIQGHKVVMDHFPYTGESNDHFEDRYEDWRPKDGGSWLLHGHVHGAWRQRGRQINVGVDAWGGFPVHEDEIIDLIAAGPRDLPAIGW
jgi:calcineurin-like phosphoesterase family protein